MKRLQLRNYNSTFESRELAVQFFHDIANDATVRGQKFGESLYAEPMVAKYLDEDGDTQVILAIGVESGKSEYHLIDSAKLAKDVDGVANEIGAVASGLSEEIARATEAESALTEAISKVSVKMSAITPSESNVRDEFVLTNADGDVFGDHIKIYKDSALLAAQIGYKDAEIKMEGGEPVKDESGNYVFVYENVDTDTEYLYLIYQNADGNLAMVGIDFEKFIIESEVGNGLQVDDESHKISIKVDAADEGYLNVSENGIKTEGIDDAIETAKQEAIAYVDDVVGSATTDFNKNKIISKDVVLTPTASGVNLTIQTDERTITKLASAGTIYDTNVAVLGTLLTMKKVTPSASAIKDAYELQDGNGTKIGDRIEIAKESALYSVGQGHVGDLIDTTTGNYIQEGQGDDTLNFIYLKADGTYELVQVIISDYFTDAHFGRGLQNLDGVVSIATPNDEQYLYVGEDIIGTSGITEAITAAMTSAVSYTDAIAVTLATKEGLAIAISSAKTEMEGVIAGAVADGVIEAEQYADAQIEDAVGDALDEAKQYTDTQVGLASASTLASAEQAVADAVAEINGVKVVDVVYDRDVNSPKYIQLRLADGTLTDGFDASSFLVDGVLTSVTLEGDNLVFVWNDDNNTRIEVPLTNLADIYTVASGSVSYLKIDGTEVSVHVDHDGGYAKTLASTDYVDAVDNKVATLSGLVNTNTNAIATLNGSAAVPGSVLHTVTDKFARDIIYGGLPATDVTIEDARENSLLRKIIVDGEDRYYVTSRADAMLYIPESGDPVNLNTYITGLKNEIEALKGRVTELENNALDEEDVKNIIKGYLEGTAKEIKIAEANDKLKIGFADDAIFGDYLAG